MGPEQRRRRSPGWYARAARAEASLVWRLRADWRSYAIPVLMAALAVLYWRWPNDLIADSIPVYGRIDDCTVVLAAALVARFSVVRRALRPWTHRHTAGELALAVSAWCAAPVILRLALGRWPDRHTRRLFGRGMARHYAPLPPLLRGLALIPQTTPQLRHLLELAHADPPAAPDAPLLVPSRALLSIPPHAGNPLLAWTGPAVAFLHFEKAAGTSVLHWLAEHFHPDQIDPDPCRSLPPHLFARTAAFPRRYALVHGHYDRPSLDRLGQPRLICTVLREPRARILALYHYWRSVRPEFLAPDDGNHTLILAHRLGLLAFLRAEDPFLRDYIDNCYARRLTGRYAEAAADPLDEPDSLAAATDALARFAVIGVSERLQASIGVLAAHLALPPPAAAPRANVMDENARADPRFRAVPREPITPDIAAELDRLTRLDRPLYAQAQARLAADIDKYERNQGTSGGRDRD